MHRAWLAIVLLAGCGSSAPRAPERAPDFQVMKPDGARVEGATLWRDGPVLLVFMTAW